jgi:hypothetical protein
MLGFGFSLSEESKTSMQQLNGAQGWPTTRAPTCTDHSLLARSNVQCMGATHGQLAAQSKVLLSMN